MDTQLAFIIFIVIVALIFDFLNGFHDAANSIATIVSTRVLRPSHAVIWAAFFNFIAFKFFDLHVANTLGKNIIDPAVVDPNIILAALTGAIFWNIFTWYFGIPSSSSHALIGGLIGAALVKSGPSSLMYSGIGKVALYIVLSPLIGFLFAFIITNLVNLICYRFTPLKVDGWFRKLQFLSASLYSLGHGGNDAQKTMGIIAILLFSSGYLGDTFHVPDWIVYSCHAAMGVGTLFGGWRIVKTMGMRITKLKPMGGFCAETAGASMLFIATHIGIPVSTTHTITGSIMGVGAVQKFSAVRWGVARGIVIAWIVTIPASALVAALTGYALIFFQS